MFDKLDEVLPGRTAVESRALKPLLDALERVRSAHDRRTRVPRPSTSAHVRSHFSRLLAELPEQQAKEQAAESALRGKTASLEEARRAMLPADARDLSIHTDGDRYDDGRYVVTCRTSDFAWISLGGCTTLGSAPERLRWFEAELAARSSSASGASR
jgi:hypothetical protein